MIKYLILGAGPAGLSFACNLKKRGCDDFIVLEKDECAGGLCRSVWINDSYIDIGGGHFLDVARPKVTRFLFDYMPEEEWNTFVRDSRINHHGKLISHPFESNIWQLDIDEQVEYLCSIARAGCNSGLEIPSNFSSWIRWKLGDKIAENYMIPYNKKIYGYEFENLGTYWLEKLPNVSFEETLKSCLTHKAYGKQPGHATFMYPKKYGYGELWTRMAETIKDNIVFNQCVKEINIKTKSVETADGQIYSAETIITSIPWETLSNISGAPDYIICSIKELKRNSIQIDYYADNLDTDAHWIYYPDSNISFHRILNKRTFSPLGGGYWTETNVNRIEKRNEVTPIFSYVNEYAYPLNTINKPDIMKSLIEFFTNLNIFPLGRWGEHQHYNSDVVVEKALNLSNSLPV